MDSKVSEATKPSSILKLGDDTGNADGSENADGNADDDDEKVKKVSYWYCSTCISYI